MNTLHVVHIISGLGQGGAETVLYRLVTAPDQPVQYTVISLSDQGVFGAKLKEAGVPVIALGMKRGLSALTGMRALRRTLRQLQPDVVQTWMYHADLIGGIAARLAGIKAVSWGIRNSGATLHKGSWPARISAWCCARLSGVVPAVIVACAQDAAKRHACWGYAQGKLQVIPNGYDFARWQPDPYAGNSHMGNPLRQQWGVDPGAPLIGSVARWNPLKDHANLLAAVAICAAQVPDLQCVLVGRGMDATNHSLMALIDQHGLRSHVILLGPRQDIPDVMAALDVHVLSSCAEGFPNVVVEAMASGTLCVVTDVGDAATIIGANGWVVPARNSGALAQAMQQAVLWRGTHEAANRVEAARNSVVQRFGLQTMVGRYLDVWQSIAQHCASTVSARGSATLHQTASPFDVAAAHQPISHGRKLLIVVNNPAFFLSHRLPIALAAKQAGYDVHVATMHGPSVPEIVGHGLTHHIIPLSRSGKNPMQELHSIYALWRLFRRLQPDIVHAVTIKPVLYGGIAARLARVPAFVAAVSGLGYLFTRHSGRFDVVRTAAITLYKLALGHANSRVIFQNGNDLAVLRDAGVVRNRQAVLVRGSGVDLNKFRAVPEPHDTLTVVMASRLLRDKGVVEFVGAARQVATQRPNVRWVLAGSIDLGNPASLTEAELAAWRQEGIVQCVGEQHDIASLYAESSMVVLPSYREGLPKSLIEAAACARAVVTTDVPGCRDAITPDVTGLLVPARDANALADAILCLIDDAGLRQRMGQAGRQLAEREFDIRQVQQAHLDVYASLLEH